ncbi:hypothetical protein BASA81_009071 [Batrachochytrium salamandrivorans]|nr:hypothetical protein BASA81_009071 [Batrachochytrium salamandrivorans]
MALLNPNFEIVISHPFCLPYGNAPIHRLKRRWAMEQMQASLGADWELFDIDGILPAIMRKRKACLLRHRVVRSEELFQRVVRINQPFASKRQVISVTHSAYFWDFGLCAVDVVIEFKLVSADGLCDDLYQVVEEFEDEMLREDAYKPPGVSSWIDVQQQFSKAFYKAGMKQIHWLVSPQAETYLLETCCWNLLARIQPTGTVGGISVSMDTLQRALGQFCGGKPTEDTFECGAKEYFATHTGYSGNAAIVYNNEDAERVQWLWKAVAILYSALLESAEPCYDFVTSLIDEQGISVEKITSDIRLVQKVIDMLHAEANPVTICSESFDAEIYEKVWNCWGGKEIDTMIDSRTSFLMSTLQDLSQQKIQALQNRLNVVVFVLTIVSVASTVAAIIALQDPGNELAPTLSTVFGGMLQIEKSQDQFQAQ